MELFVLIAFDCWKEGLEEMNTKNQTHRHEVV
jgi:hypothetical protein